MNTPTLCTEKYRAAYLVEDTDQVGFKRVVAWDLVDGCLTAFVTNADDDQLVRASEATDGWIDQYDGKPTFLGVLDPDDDDDDYDEVAKSIVADRERDRERENEDLIVKDVHETFDVTVERHEARILLYVFGLGSDRLDRMPREVFQGWLAATRWREAK